AYDCRCLVEDRRRAIVPIQLRAQVKKLPEWGYGVKRVKVTLANGRTYTGVFVSWDTEVIGIAGGTGSFDARDIVQVHQDSERPPTIKSPKSDYPLETQ